MNNESLAQIGEAYIQAQQKEQEEKKENIVEIQTKEEKDEFDIKILGKLICEVMNIIFSRIGWKKLNIEEERLLSDSFIGIIRKRVPKAIKWGDEINFGVIMMIIILSRINISEKYKKEENKNENKRITNNINSGPPRRGKNLFSVATIKEIK